MAVKSHPIYSRDATVHIESGSDKLPTLDRAIQTSAFLDQVEAVYHGSGKSKDDFLVAIKPNIMTASIREDGSPIYTDPQLVEHLIGRLREAGFSNIAIVEARNVYDYTYTGRSVAAVAEMVGYSGNGYRIEDLSAQKESFDYGGVLGRHVVGRTWRDADYRISFAKNKTHWQCFYTGCLKNIYGCLPEWDKMRVYHGKGREFFECCILILDAFPVHFGFLDAWVSADGFAGHVRDGKPNQTHTILASQNIFALDWVAGEKMGLDPSLNYVIQEAIYRWGAIRIDRRGNMSPWQPWTNVRSLTVLALDALEESNPLSRFASRAFASKGDPRFKPVSRWHWFFAPIQAVVAILERYVVKPRT